MFWSGLDVVWGGLGCFGVVWGVSTDPISSALNSRRQLLLTCKCNCSCSVRTKSRTPSG